LEAAFFWLLKRDNWLSFIFWRRIVQDFVKGWTFPAVSIYVVFLALGIPAIVPPTGGDPVSYHLAYAADWANAGRIYVDRHEAGFDASVKVRVRLCCNSLGAS